MPKSVGHITKAYIERIKKDQDISGASDFLKAVQSHYDPHKASLSVDCMADYREEPTIGYLFNILRDSDLLKSDEFFAGVLRKYLAIDGKKIDDVWERGCTTLFQYACVKAPRQTIQLLIDKGADTKRGPITPIAIAREWDNQEAITCLTPAGVVPPPPVIMSSPYPTPPITPQSAAQNSQLGSRKRSRSCP